MEAPKIIDVLRDDARVGSLTAPLDPSASAAVVDFCDRQEQEVKRLRAALQAIIDLGGAHGSRAWMAEADRIAREALAHDDSKEPSS